MKKLLFWSIIVSIAFSILFIINAETNPTRKVALVIGNGAYKTNRLKNPPNDAADISDNLKKLGFTVTKLIDANKQKMQEAIRDFGRELMKDWNTMGMFYYAGHGCNVKGINYLIPVGSDIKAEDEVEYQAVDVGFVLSKMESAGNRVNILILDACRDNPFSSSRSGNRGLTVVEAPKGSLIVYATAPGSVAADGKGRNGVFTDALLKNLKDNPSMDIELFMRNVRKDVMAETGNEQVPWTSSSLTESIAFKAKPAESKPATPPEKKTETTPAEEKKASTIKTEENPQLKQKFDLLLEYGGHTYYISKQRETWQEAKKICEQNGGHLVTITSSEENNAIINVIKSYKPNANIWIGFTDIDSEGRWKWVTGERTSYTKWDQHQPDNGGGNYQEDCAAIMVILEYWVKNIYSWNDAPANDKNLFILEMEDSQNTTVSTIKTEENSQLKAPFDLLLKYGGHTYYVSKQGATWHEAKKICEQNGGHLVTITSDEENEAIVEAVKTKNIDKDLWLGYTDENKEGKWIWITGEESSFSYWDEGQPDNFNRSEDYAMIWIATLTHWRKLPYHWGDFPEDRMFYFILEIDGIQD
ncbi:MAG: caspase family protein [Spirochaetales bacterium]|nr:caspase family protein [Spirochaetales bacterium]